MLQKLHVIAFLIVYFAVYLLIPARATAQGFGPELETTIYKSPSGEFELRVEPSDRRGGGSATYELKQRGTLVWSGERTFTLWGAAVTNDGTVGGYAYSNGYEGFGAAPDNFIVIIIDPKGNIRLAEKTKRVSSRFPHGSPDPKAQKLIMDPSNDRMIIIISDPDVNTAMASWWNYQLSTGKALNRFTPRALMPDHQYTSWAIDARPITGAPLTLVQWWRFESKGPSNNWKYGTRFTIIDFEGKPVWSLELPQDYTIANDEKANDALHDEIGESGAILQCDKSLQFELRHVASAKRVTYQISKDGTAPSGWTVKEIAKKDYNKEIKKGAIESRPSLDDLSSVPEIQLKSFGAISIKSGSAAATSPIRDIINFNIDTKNRFGFLRRGNGEGWGWEFVLVDRDGKLVKSLNLPKPYGKDSATLKIAPESDGRWLLTYAGYGEEAKTDAFHVDPEMNKIEPIDGLDSYPAESIAADGDSGFVILGKKHFKYTISDGLFAFDGKGILRWSVGQQYEDKTKLFSPTAIARVTTGEIAVLENVANDVKLYSASGSYIKTIDLQKAWKRKPNYPSDICSDGEGGVYIYDFNGDPSIIQMTLDGAVIAEFSPVRADRSKISIRKGLHADGEGRIWITDGDAFYRCNSKGVVDATIGPEASPDELGKPARVEVDTNSNIYILDDRTSSVHVFDASGKSKFICKPRPEDINEKTLRKQLLVAGDGSVYITKMDYSFRTPPTFLHFSRTGERIGVESLNLDTVSQEWAFQPGSDRRWVVGYEVLYLIDTDQTTVKTIKKCPDGNWYRSSVAQRVSVDGSIAIVSTAGLIRKEGSPGIHIFSAGGDPVHTLPLLPFINIYSQFVYNGHLFIFSACESSDGKRTPSGIVAIDVAGKLLWRFAPAGDAKNLTPFLAAGGKELWLYDGRFTFERYELPAMK